MVHLNQLTEDTFTPKRVKILLNSDGNFSGEIKDFQPSDKAFKVRLAPLPVSSNDRFLFHKTTCRDVYEKSMLEGYDDVLLFNEKDELTEFTIGNLVVKIGGEMFTPPVECGLLPGTFRMELVESRKVTERIIRIDDLEKCDEVFLVNSLRGWVKAEIKKRSTG